MPTIHLPESARAYTVDEEQRQMLDELEGVTGLLAHYNRELKAIDEHLSVVLAKPSTSVAGLKPGYFHIVRMRPGTLAYIKPIEGPNGEWRELDSSVLDLVAEDDLWNDRARRHREDATKRARESAERDRIRWRQAKAAEFDERLHSATSTTISVPQDI